MTIQNIKLSDKFHAWVAATNLIIEEINREIVLGAKQKLKTIDKSTIVAAINELYDKKLNKDEDVNLSNNDIVVQSVLSNTKIQVGSEGKGNSLIEFYDDSNNLYRKFLFNHNDKSWYVENGDGNLEKILTANSTIDGNNQEILLKRLPNDEFKNYTGPEGSLSYNLVTKTVHVHDGFTQGGISFTSAGLTLDKVKTDSTDSQSGYLSDKIIAGNGIQLLVDNVSGENKLSIINEMYNEFNDSAANTYVKRNNNNSAYQFLTNSQVVNDLKVGKIYSVKKSFTNNIILEDNIYTYTSTPTEDTIISFNTGNLTNSTESIEFEIILTLNSVLGITFSDTIKWKDNETPTLTTTGTYIYKFKTINNGLTWLGKLEDYYPN